MSENMQNCSLETKVQFLNAVNKNLLQNEPIVQKIVKDVVSKFLTQENGLEGMKNAGMSENCGIRVLEVMQEESKHASDVELFKAILKVDSIVDLATVLDTKSKVLQEFVVKTFIDDLLDA